MLSLISVIALFVLGIGLMASVLVWTMTTNLEKYAAFSVFTAIIVWLVAIGTVIFSGVWLLIWIVHVADG